MYVLSTKSLKKLHNVHPDLVEVVCKAIRVTEVDFTVLEGMRSLERQKELVQKGASWTMNSKHLTGHAVDLGAWVDGEVRWDWPLYIKIAEAMREASISTNIPLVWGGVWDRRLSELLVDWNTLDQEMMAYADRKRNKFRPTFDGPHFQLA